MLDTSNPYNYKYSTKALELPLMVLVYRVMASAAISCTVTENKIIETTLRDWGSFFKPYSDATFLVKNSLNFFLVSIVSITHWCGICNTYSGALL